MKVLITGHRGFIGSHLKLDGMVGFDIKDSPEHDITNPYAVEDFWTKHKPEVVVHLAANSKVDLSMKYPWWDVQTNVGGIINVLQSSHKNNVKLFIFASTCQVYSVDVRRYEQHEKLAKFIEEHGIDALHEDHTCNPKSPYAISKYAGEFYCKVFQRKGLNTCILRFFNVYGPGQSKGLVVPDLIEKILLSKGVVKVLGPPDDSRDFVYVTDVADALQRTVAKGEEVAGETFNIGSGVETTIKELCTTIATASGEPVSFNYAQRPLGRFPGRYRAWIAKARDRLGWTPTTTLREGIQVTVDDWRV